MPISKEEAQDVTRTFARDYPGALRLAYRFRQDTVALYGSRAAEVPATMKGGYAPRPTTVNGRTYQGLVDVALANASDASDLLATLQHEVIGHFGVNTFSPAHRRALLESLAAAKNEPSLIPLWDAVELTYPSGSLVVRAEEVFALAAEGVRPRHRLTGQANRASAIQIHAQGQRSFVETCLSRLRPMHAEDLSHIVAMVAEGLHDLTRVQRTFPYLADDFSKDINNQLARTMEAKKPFHETVAEKLIAQLKQGTAPWQKPWAPGDPAAVFPLNPTTGQRYKGINAIYLMAQGRSDQRWMTYRQAETAGAQVRKGERGTSIQYWKFEDEAQKFYAQGKPVLDRYGKPVMERVKLERPRVFYATVFNAEQIDGLPAVHRDVTERNWTAVERAEFILAASGATLKHESGNRAYYRTSTDTIHLPEKSQFATADNYYAVALHELGHWSGHASRLNRDLSHPFGSEGYAKEELRAEIASMILGDTLGIGHDPGQHAAYVKSWIAVLENDPLEIFRAAADAEKIQGFVMALERKLEQQQDHDQMLTQHAEPRQMSSLPGYAMRYNDSPGKAGAEVVFPDGSLLSLRGTEAIQRFSIEHRLATQDVEALMAFDAMAGRRLRSVSVAPGRTGTQKDVRPPHEVTLVEFSAQAQVQKLENHGRQWEVRSGDGYSAFSDSSSALAALADVHRGAVNNALYLNMPGTSTSMETPSMPPRAVLAEYPDLVAAYPEIFQGSVLSHVPEKAVPEVRTYLAVPFADKEEAKALGAKWDRQQQSWYAPPGADFALFSQWLKGPEMRPPAQSSVEEPLAQGVTPTIPRNDRRYLAVPFEDRSEAKAAGASWDKVVKSWYVGPNADIDKLQRWAPENVEPQQGPAMHPREEFAQAMRGLGLVVEGEHPIMDGQKHRVPVEGGKPGAVDGFYVLFPDGLPAGRIINHKTGADEKWHSKGYTLNPAQRASMQAEAAASLVRRAATIAEKQQEAANRVARQLDMLQPIEQPTPYLAAKGVQVHPGAFTDAERKTTFIPAIDADNKLWSMQYIQEDGTKRFAKDGRKEGTFHAIGGLEALAKAPVIVIGEGYATAATLSDALGFGTVAGFDAGNLKAVAAALKAKFPEKPMVIAGDDDHQREAIEGKNPGREKMEQAAKAVGATTLLPIFGPGERSSRPELTDFNDLATKSVLGLEGVVRQARAAVETALVQKAMASGQERAVGQAATDEVKLVQTKKQRRGMRLDGGEGPRQKQKVKV